MDASLQIIQDLPPLREVIAQNDLSARKQLGQNFLLDLNLTQKIARAAGDLRDQTVIEVGPGPGGLTRALLLSGARRVVAIEHDERCITALQPLVAAAQGRLELHHLDALKMSLKDFETGPFTIVANLPYNIATPLLIGWLAHRGLISSMTLMFQKEVAERLVALPSTKAYGRLSIITQASGRCRRLFDIPASAFTPAPKVTSSVVQITPFPIPSWSFSALEILTQAAFGQRRKMLRSSLKSLFPNVEQILLEAKLDPQRRAETLQVQEFIHLTKWVS